MKSPEQEPVDFAFVLATSVHDMKNSLGMLLNTLSDVMTRFPAQTPEQEKSYGVLEYEASRINSELVQLLSLYRLEQDQIHVHVDEYSVRDLLDEQVARNADLLASRRISLEVSCDNDLFGYFDADLLGSVINNVLVNAARYTRNTIRLSAEEAEGGVKIVVEDDGSGFPAAMLDPDSWLSSRANFAAGRPHLGLMFASRIAQMHKNKGKSGQILLDNLSILGGGRFAIWIP